MSEADLQSSVMELAGALGWLVYHTHDSRRSQAGFPDLVLVHARAGRLLMRELKSERGQVTSEQSLWLGSLLAAGVDAGVWRPWDLLEGRVLAALREGVA